MFVFSGSFPEVCNHFELWYVCHKCMYDTFKATTDQEGLSKGFTGESNGSIVLEECSTKAIFTDHSLQD